MIRSIDVWEKLSNTCAIRYRCFEIISKGEYFVQSADYYHLPIEESDLRFIDEQFIELIIKDSLGSSKKTYSSLEEAIEMHKKNFRVQEKGGLSAEK